MTIKDKLIEKSKEAFALAIEIYNKPTIKYRVEGFAFFICNAWELMLKAHMIDKFGTESIYYKDNPTRTLSLENCVQKVFTNEKSPLRLNLSRIIELRNTSTHFLMEEYEMIYVPLFQACLFNFIDKMKDFHNVDMTEVVPQNFVTLSISMNALNEQKIRAKYPEEIANKIINQSASIGSQVIDNNDKFAIKIEHWHYLTKDKNEAATVLRLEKDAEAPVKILRDLKDPNNTHKFTMKSANEEINRRLRSEGIDIVVNNYIFLLFDKVFGIKQNEDYCYVHKQFSNKQYTYSYKTIDLIVNEIKRDPENIIARLKEKSQPQEQRNS